MTKAERIVDQWARLGLRVCRIDAATSSATSLSRVDAEVMVANALLVADAEEIIHRDLKPENMTTNTLIAKFCKELKRRAAILSKDDSVSEGMAAVLVEIYEAIHEVWQP